MTVLGITAVSEFGAIGSKQGLDGEPLSQQDLPQAAQSLDLDLTHPLPGQANLGPHVFESRRLVTEQAEAASQR